MPWQKDESEARERELLYLMKRFNSTWKNCNTGGEEEDADHTKDDICSDYQGSTGKGMDYGADHKNAGCRLKLTHLADI